MNLITELLNLKRPIKEGLEKASQIEFGLADAFLPIGKKYNKTKMAHLRKSLKKAIDADSVSLGISRLGMQGVRDILADSAVLGGILQTEDGQALSVAKTIDEEGTVVYNMSFNIDMLKSMFSDFEKLRIKMAQRFGTVENIMYFKGNDIGYVTINGVGRLAVLNGLKVIFDKIIKDDLKYDWLIIKGEVKTPSKVTEAEVNLDPLYKVGDKAADKYGHYTITDMWDGYRGFTRNEVRTYDDGKLRVFSTTLYDDKGNKTEEHNFEVLDFLNGDMRASEEKMFIKKVQQTYSEGRLGSNVFGWLPMSKNLKGLLMKKLDDLGVNL